MPELPPAYFTDVYEHPDNASSIGALVVDGEENLRGFQLMAARRLDLPRGRFTVIRSAAFKARDLDHRPRAFDRFGPVSLLRLALQARAEGRQPWLLATSSVPTTYHRLAPLFVRIVPPPQPDAATDPARARCFRDLARALGIDLDPEHHWTTRSPPQQYLSEAARAQWRVRAEPAVRRLIGECPDFGAGQALVFGTPLGLRDLLGVVSALLRRRSG